MTADNVSFGDRHLRVDPQGKLNESPAITGARVRLTLSRDVAASRVGQLGAWLCVNLLARLDGLVDTIVLEAPHVATTTALAKLSMREASIPEALSVTLAKLCEDVSAGRTRLVVAANQSERARVEVVIGSSAEPGAAERVIWCFGRGWRAFAGARRDTTIEPLGEQDRNPLGMYLAVCYAVGEVFKVLRGVKSGVRGAQLDCVYSSLWSGTNAPRWADLQEGPELAQTCLPATYLIGAGAVGQAVAFAVATSELDVEFVTILDEQQIDRTNRNRYILAGRAHEGRQKALHLATFLRRHGIPIHCEDLHWRPYLTRLNTHPHPPLAAAEADFRFRLVLSCVDGNVARHEIQRVLPGDLLGGSTDGLRAMAVHYDLREATACLACHNQLSPFESQLEDLRKKLLPLAPQDRRTRLAELGFAADVIDSVDEYLQNAKCGELGEAALRKFAEDGPPTFAVGFVSVSAGLLLARHWIKFALGGPAAVRSDDGHYLNVNFLNGRMLWTEQGVRSGCDCTLHGRAAWHAMWSGSA